MSLEGKENVDKDALRSELKEWERAFKEANGRKASRADIKNDATIDAKYRLYDRIARRKEIVPKVTPRKTVKSKDAFHETKRDDVRTNISATPRKAPPPDSHLAVPSPAPAEVEATPAFIKAALGPTPQKDGQVLGIFDIPSATPLHNTATQRPGVSTLITATPSKSGTAPSENPFSRTPQSSGKRFFLDAFAGTPLKRKRAEGDVGTTSASKRQFATPAFLRRSFPLASIDEESAEPRAAPAPFRKRGLVRSLSSIIQGLKKQEEERMDDEWDVMREIEEEEEYEGGKPVKEAPKIVVPDSQAVEMPLGPDEAPLSEDEGGGEDGQATGRKPWKKKGLKRQTKRVKMKPVLHKVKKAGDLEVSDDSEADVVAETQPSGDADDEDATFAPGEEGPKKSKPKSKTKEDADAGDSSKKKGRKVNPDAHANFRKLKIKNKNSKANGRGGRFGRR